MSHSQQQQQLLNQRVSRKSTRPKDFTPIYVWGSDAYGQLGQASKEVGKIALSPRFTSFSVLIEEIACGEQHSAFIAQNGYVYAMGNNSQGQLGLALNQNYFKSAPTLVEALKGIRAVSLSCGAFHTAVVSNQGDLFSWGCNDQGQLGIGSDENMPLPQKVELEDVISVACGRSNTIAIANKGQMWGFGDGRAGQLGTGCEGNEFFPREIIYEGSDIVIAVSCGDTHSLFLTQGGQILACGNNEQGQLGCETEGIIQNTVVPIRVQEDSEDQEVDVQFVKVAAGYQPFSAALSSQGELYLWGSGFFGESGVPTQSTSIQNRFLDFSIGHEFICLLDISGKVYTWGDNTEGRLGLGEEINEAIEFPMRVSKIKEKSVRRVISGSNFVFAMGEDWIHQQDKKEDESQNSNVEEKSRSCSKGSRIEKKNRQLAQIQEYQGSNSTKQSSSHNHNNNIFRKPKEQASATIDSHDIIGQDYPMVRQSDTPQFSDTLFHNTLQSEKSKKQTSSIDNKNTGIQQRTAISTSGVGQRNKSQIVTQKQLHQQDIPQTDCYDENSLNPSADQSRSAIINNKELEIQIEGQSEDRLSRNSVEYQNGSSLGNYRNSYFTGLLNESEQKQQQNRTNHRLSFSSAKKDNRNQQHEGRRNSFNNSFSGYKNRTNNNNMVLDTDTNNMSELFQQEDYEQSSSLFNPMKKQNNNIIDINNNTRNPSKQQDLSFLLLFQKYEQLKIKYSRARLERDELEDRLRNERESKNVLAQQIQQANKERDDAVIKLDKVVQKNKVQQNKLELLETDIKVNTKAYEYKIKELLKKLSTCQAKLEAIQQVEEDNEVEEDDELNGGSVASESYDIIMNDKIPEQQKPPTVTSKHNKESIFDSLFKASSSEDVSMDVPNRKYIQNNTNITNKQREGQQTKKQQQYQYSKYSSDSRKMNNYQSNERSEELLSLKQQYVQLIKDNERQKARSQSSSSGQVNNNNNNNNNNMVNQQQYQQSRTVNNDSTQSLRNNNKVDDNRSEILRSRIKNITLPSSSTSATYQTRSNKNGSLEQQNLNNKLSYLLSRSCTNDKSPASISYGIVNSCTEPDQQIRNDKNRDGKRSYSSSSYGSNGTNNAVRHSTQLVDEILEKYRKRKIDQISRDREYNRSSNNRDNSNNISQDDVVRTIKSKQTSTSSNNVGVRDLNLDNLNVSFEIKRFQNGLFPASCSAAQASQKQPKRIRLRYGEH